MHFQGAKYADMVHPQVHTKGKPVRFGFRPFAPYEPLCSPNVALQ